MTPLTNTNLVGVGFLLFGIIAILIGLCLINPAAALALLGCGFVWAGWKLADL